MLSNGTLYVLDAYSFNTCIVTNMIVPNHKEYSYGSFRVIINSRLTRLS